VVPVLRQFFTGPLSALDPLSQLWGPSGQKYSVRDVDELDSHVQDLYRRTVNARQRGNRRLAAQFTADSDALLERRLYLTLIADDTPED
jgi:hypothetical protein